MNVIGHEDISEEVKAVSLAGLFKYSLENVAGCRGLDDMGVAMATDREEVELAALLAAD